MDTEWESEALSNTKEEECRVKMSTNKNHIKIRDNQKER